MPVLRNLENEITKAVGIAKLDVIPFSRSSANVVMVLKGGGRAFFAKIYTDAVPDKPDANRRYDREKAILSKRWPVGMPRMVYSADVERLIVTSEVQGFGFKHFMDLGETIDALGRIARWVAGFHAAAATEPRPGSLWEDFIQYKEFRDSAAFTELRPLLSAYPLTEYVLTKGDCTASNFKFNQSGVIGLDFENVGMRAKEYDLVALAQGLHGLTGESVRDMVATIVQQYDAVRPIADADATVAAVTAIVEATDY